MADAFPSKIDTRYPLLWPDDRPRTAADQRKPALWRDGGSRISLSKARKRLTDQVHALTRPRHNWRTLNMVLATNIRFTASGARDMNFSRRDPVDCGAAFYFELDGRPHVLACDRWDALADNVAAIAAHIEALRGQERWGVADLRQAFAGHVALPAPELWWQVLEVAKTATSAEIETAYREKARVAHPDKGGSNVAMSRLNAARDAAGERP